MRTAGRALARRLEEIPAHPAYLRESLAALSPAMAGVSAGRWSNVVGLTRAALKIAGVATMPGRYTEPLTSAWAELYRHLNHRRLREGLSRFARFCGSCGITPFEVDDGVAAAFLRVLENRGIIRKPRQVHRMMCITWNRAANTLATWPQSRLAVPSTKRITRLAGTTSRGLSQQRPQPYLDRLAGKDLLAELDFRPLRPASIIATIGSSAPSCPPWSTAVAICRACNPFPLSSPSKR